MAYKSAAAYADKIIRMANQPETMYKMGLISYDEMLDHNACPLKYKGFIDVYHDKYTYDNIKHIDPQRVSWYMLSLKTDAKIILAHCDKEWRVKNCAFNKTFSFHEFETLMKFKKSFASVVYFHTITSSIVTKYKSHFVRHINHGHFSSIVCIYSGWSSLSVEVFDDHPDIFDVGVRQALLPYCRDFNLNKCDNPQQVVNDALFAVGKKNHSLYTVNHIWKYIHVTKFTVHQILDSNQHVTIEVVNKYLANYLKKCDYLSPCNYEHMPFDVLSFIIKHYQSKIHIRHLLMKNKNLTWKDMQNWTIANASVKYEDTNANLLYYSEYVNEDDSEDVVEIN
jgi:hypothetical protein